VRYADQANKADVGINSWLSPPGNTYETTDIWIDSPVNNYGTFRYGSWSDLMGGTIPVGNGDDPAIGQINRIYARVRNYGNGTASNVVAHFDVTDPLGVGVNGSNGFVEIGSVNSASFPGLASIPAGESRDVYIEWTPNLNLTPAQIAAGAFAFHSCVRVRIDHLTNETVFGNQDGDGQQENIEYFQAPTPGPPMGGVNTTTVHLRNDSNIYKKYFNLAYDNSRVPKDWEVSVNHGQLGLELLPNEVRDIPVEITPNSPMAPGEVASVTLVGTSLQLLPTIRTRRTSIPSTNSLAAS
jgi:hypothetical protein